MKTLVLCLFAGIMFGCGQQQPAPSQSPQDRPPLLMERSVVALMGTASKNIGDLCPTQQPGECISGLCLHALTSKGATYLCSQTCRAGSDCPKGWACIKDHPNASDGVCIPSGGTP